MTTPTDRVHLGAAWYPEHWPEDRWPEDVRLMAESGFTVVRMGEFAWSALQPSRDTFDFDWLERAIELAAQSGLRSVLGTPTAAPPAWLVEAHPDLLAVDESGRRVQFGNRCHYCVTSPDLHVAAETIATAMAERFGANTNVIGWQIDNEYNRVCHCDRCSEQFRTFLAEQYGTLDALNERWSTRYWSQTYSSWEQIPLPIGPHNPGLMLAFPAFVTQAYRRFQRLQIDALRRHVPPHAWITHNFMHWYGGFDHYELSADLDIASWDWYVETGHNDYLSSGAAHDLVRGFKRRNFWLMETQPGHVNWQPINATQRPGEVRTMAWQAIAHGADAVLYWQWRSALGGQEQFHGALLDASGRPRPVLDEVSRLGRELEAASPILAMSVVAPSGVALLNSYPSRWSLEGQRQHASFDYVEHLVHYYRPFARRNVAVDVVASTAPLGGYRVVVAPALTVLDEGDGERLRDFVEGGGHLVLTIRTGVKDADNAVLPSRPPGPLSECAGVEVEDYYALLEPLAVEGDGLGGQASIWAERVVILDPATVRVLARFGASDEWLAGRPAITVRSIGKGRVYYVAAYLDSGVQQVLTDLVLSTADVAPLVVAPPDVEARARLSTSGDDVLVMVNHGPIARSVDLPWEAHNHVAGSAVGQRIELAAYGAAVLTRSAAEARLSTDRDQASGSERSDRLPTSGGEM
jgi:beta-galactosidase